MAGLAAASVAAAIIVSVTTGNSNDLGSTSNDTNNIIASENDEIDSNNDSVDYDTDESDDSNEDDSEEDADTGTNSNTENQSGKDSDNSSKQEKQSGQNGNKTNNKSNGNSSGGSNNSKKSNNNSDGSSSSGGSSDKPSGSTVAVTKVTLNKSSATLNHTSTMTLTATVSPSNATTKTITWTSSNTNVATVSGGKVTTKGPGTATITAKSNNGKTASCTITVKQLVTGVTISGNNQNLVFNRKNQTATVNFTAAVTPSNTTENKTITWTSSNTNVATVSGGKVTVKGIGSAVITAKNNASGKYATRTINVRKQKIIMIGNSKTYRFGKPSVYYEVKNILTNLGYDVAITVVAPGSTTLEYKTTSGCTNHSNLGGNCLSLIQNLYDIAILQEKTDTAAADLTTYNRGASSVANILRSKNSGIRLFVRQSWSTADHLNNDSSDRQSQRHINDNADTVARNISATVIRDGRAFFKNNSNNNLYNLSDNNDKNHASHKGTYLAGLCIVSKVYGVDATGVTYIPSSGVSTAEARSYREYAKAECR